MAWTRDTIVRSMAKKSNMSQHYSKIALNAFLATVEEAAVDGQSIHLQRFGTFEVNLLPEREAQNPYSREYFITPPKRQIKFKPHQTLKDSINRNIPGRNKKG